MNEVYSYFCYTCQTQDTTKRACSSCGDVMDLVTDKHSFMLVLSFTDGAAGHEIPQHYIGPFRTVSDADSWWERHHAHDNYEGLDCEIAVIEPPDERIEVSHRQIDWVGYLKGEK